MVVPAGIPVWGGFQSLGRDSVHSSLLSSGTLLRMNIVSIPRSGFCSFKLSEADLREACLIRFQSLGRDSVHSSLAPRNRSRALPGFNPSVGILFIQAFAYRLPRIAPDSFNPSVGILFIQAAFIPMIANTQLCFNPSVGILFIQADLVGPPSQGSDRFQSLGRDSVHSSPAQGNLSTLAFLFQSLGRDSVHSSSSIDIGLLPDAQVSIPRSGFCSFKR